MAEEMIEEAKPDQQKKTPEDYIREQWMEAFPDVKFDEETTTAEGRLATMRLQLAALHKGKVKKEVTKARKDLGELTRGLKGILNSVMEVRGGPAPVPDWLKKNTEATFHFDLYPTKGHLTVVVRPSGTKENWDFTKGFYLGTAFCSPKEDEEREAEKDPEKKRKLGFHPDKGEVIARIKAKTMGPIPLNLVSFSEKEDFYSFLMDLITSEEFPTWMQKAKNIALIPRGTGTSSRMGFPVNFPLDAAVTVLRAY